MMSSKNLLLSLPILALSHLANAQYSMDRYHPRELLAELGVRATEIYEVSEDGKELVTEILYDELGNEVLFIDRESKFRTEYRYDSLRKVAQYFGPTEGGYFERDTFIYNAEGQLIDNITYDNTGKVSKRMVYEYEGDLLKKEKYILGGKLHVLTEVEYDDKNRRVRNKRTFRGKPTDDEVFVYDEQGNMVEFIMVKPDGSESLHQYHSYNEQNQKTEFKVGDQLHTTSYREDGLIDFELASIEGETTRTEYAYSFTRGLPNLDR